jgi:hypothetical protein
MKELEAAESKLPGLWVCGNYRTGVAFPDCVTFGYEQAKVVKMFLDSPLENAENESSRSSEPPKSSLTLKTKKKVPFFVTEKPVAVKASTKSLDKVLA